MQSGKKRKRSGGAGVRGGRDSGTKEKKAKKTNKKQSHPTTVKNIDEAFKELVAFCEGDSLTLPLLRQKLEASPEGTVRANLDTRVNDDTTLLHYVCYNERVTLDIVEYLVSLYPEVVEVRTGRDWLPLHRACLNDSCPNEVVAYLMRIYPGALRVPWTHAGLPLHCLLSRRHCRLDLDLVKSMVDAYPEALTNQDNQHSNTPLMLACKREDVSTDMVQLLVDPDKAVFGIRNSIRSGMDLPKEDLPIEAIFRQYHNKEWRMPFDVVIYLAESAPNTLTPATFHSVCRSRNVSLEAIQLFTERRPDVSYFQQPDAEQNLPLHLLFLNEKKEDQDSWLLPIVKYVVKAYPDAVRWKNELGYLPLFYATDTTLEITKVLVEENPASVHVRSQIGLPFHSACRDGSIETVKYLFERDPTVITLDWHCVMPVNTGTSLHLPFAYGRGAIFKIPFLPEKGPHSVKAKDRKTGNLRDVEAKVHFILEKDPHSVRAKDWKTGDLPLHSACKHFTWNLSIIKHLLELYPDAVATQNRSGRLPLHCFLATNRFVNSAGNEDAAKSLETVIFLVKQFPSSVKVADEKGMLPLHLASKHYDPAIVMYLAGEYPDGVKAESPRYGLPLHCASANQNWPGPGIHVVSHLLSLYPESHAIRNEEVGLPLECTHCPEIFEMLLRQRYKDKRFLLQQILKDEEILMPAMVGKHFFDHFRRDLTQTDHHGRYPFHLAVLSPRIPLFLVKELFRAHPAAVEHQDKEGCLPLHLFLRNSASRKVEDSKLILEMLLSKYPNSVKVPDYSGSLPLHYACRSGSSLSVLKMVLDSFPEALKHKDHNGCIPLHVACRRGLLSVESVGHLIKFHRTAIGTTDNDLELPLHKACRGGHVEIVNLLVDESAPSSGKRNASGSLPVHILCQKSGKSDVSAMDTPIFTGTVWRLLRAYPEAMKCN